MARKRSKPKQGLRAAALQRQHDTVRLVNNALDTATVRSVARLAHACLPHIPAQEDGGSQLRKVAAIRGLTSNEVRPLITPFRQPPRTLQLRVRVWPVLLGVNQDDIDPNAYETLVHATHRDSNVVDVDVARSLWPYTLDWSDEARDAKRDELRRLLTATVCSNQGVYYYQGLHDIASVLLFVLGEPLAFVCLRRMVHVQLRDCTRYVMQEMGLHVPMICGRFDSLFCVQVDVSCWSSRCTSRRS